MSLPRPIPLHMEAAKVLVEWFCQTLLQIFGCPSLAHLGKTLYPLSMRNHGSHPVLSVAFLSATSEANCITPAESFQFLRYTRSKKNLSALDTPRRAFGFSFIIRFKSSRISSLDLLVWNDKAGVSKLAASN